MKNLNITARMVAHFRDNEMKHPVSERLFEDPYAMAFVDNEALKLAKKLLEALPSLETYIRLRTRAIDDWLKEALSNDIKQVVIIGCGADMRALRLNSQGVHFYELDMPGTGIIKQTILKKQFSKIDISAVRYLEIDLAQDSIDKVLVNSDFNSKLDTIFIIEGVSHYLNSSINEKMFCSIRMLSVKARVIYYYNDVKFLTDSTGINELVAHRESLKEAGFPVVFGIDDIKVFANKCGFDVEKDVKMSEVHCKYIPNEPFNNEAGKHFGLAMLVARD